MNHLTQLLIVLAAFLSLTVVVEGTCRCTDVCPSHVPGAWNVSTSCPRDAPEGGIELSGVSFPGGGCVCNFFGCNCNACSCPKQRAVFRDAASCSCQDYETYMSMTQSEKVQHLASFYCTKQDDNGEVVQLVRREPRQRIDRLVELIADVDDDGELSCEEFNNAYFDMNGFDRFCLK